MQIWYSSYFFLLHLCSITVWELNLSGDPRNWTQRRAILVRNIFLQNAQDSDPGALWGLPYITHSTSLTHKMSNTSAFFPWPASKSHSYEALTFQEKKIHDVFPCLQGWGACAAAAGATAELGSWGFIKGDAYILLPTCLYMLWTSEQKI